MTAALALRAASASADLDHPFLSSFGSFSQVLGVAVSQSSEDVYVYGSALAACTFEYGETESYRHSVPCAETVGQIGSGSKLSRSKSN